MKVDIIEKEEILEYLKDFSKEISRELIKKGIEGKTITIKYKTYDFIYFKN